MNRCCSAETQPACHQKRMPPPGNMREGGEGERGEWSVREATEAAAANDDDGMRMWCVLVCSPRTKAMLQVQETNAVERVATPHAQTLQKTTLRMQKQGSRLVTYQ